MEEDLGRDFWIAIGLWGAAFLTVFGTGLFGLFLEKQYISGAALTAIGLGGITYMSLHLKGRRLTKTHAITGALVLTWLFFAYDIYDRHQQGKQSISFNPATNPLADSEMSGLIQGYGDCWVQIDGSKLSHWQQKYDVGLICGANRRADDMYAATGISVSTLHSIHPELMPLEVLRSPQMTIEISEIVRHAIANAAPAPKGMIATVNVPIWNEIVLLPKGFDMRRIHTLDDVYSNGGIIVSREFPKCIACMGVFDSPEVQRSLFGTEPFSHPKPNGNSN